MSQGPIEDRLRARMNYGLGATRTEVHAIGDRLAIGIADRLVREGVAVFENNRYRMATHKPDVEAIRAAEDERRRRFEARRVAELERVARAAKFEEDQAAARARRAEEERQIARFASCKSPEERRRLEEEIHALARAGLELERMKRKAPVQELAGQALGNVFGIVIDE